MNSNTHTQARVCARVCCVFCGPFHCSTANIKSESDIGNCFNFHHKLAGSQQACNQSPVAGRKQIVAAQAYSACGVTAPHSGSDDDDTAARVCCCYVVAVVIAVCCIAS